MVCSLARQFSTMEPKYEINFNYEAFAIGAANCFGQGCSLAMTQTIISHFNRAYLTLRHSGFIEQVVLHQGCSVTDLDRPPVAQC